MHMAKNRERFAIQQGESGGLTARLLHCDGAKRPGLAKAQVSRLLQGSGPM